MRHLHLSRIVIAAFAVSQFAAGTPISVNNFSFESFNPLTSSCNGSDCAFNFGPIPGWTTTGTSGSFRPGNPSNTDYFNFIPDGVIVAYSNSGTIRQDVGTVAANTIYTLLVDVGNRKEQAATGVVELLVGATAYAASPVAIAEGGWSTFSVVYNALPGDVGQTLAIRLSAQAAQGNFDNVRLDATAVPEPASAALVALGLASAWVVRRRRNG